MLVRDVQQQTSDGWSEELFDRVLGVMPQALIVCAPNSEIVGWNAAAERRFGWRTPDVLGRTFEELQMEQIQELATEAGRTGTSVEREVLVRCEDGRLIRVMAHVRVLAPRQDANGSALVVLTDFAPTWSNESGQT